MIRVVSNALFTQTRVPALLLAVSIRPLGDAGQGEPRHAIGCMYSVSTYTYHEVMGGARGPILRGGAQSGQIINLGLIQGKKEKTGVMSFIY